MYTLRVALFGALVLLTGCTTHYRNSIHPSYGQTEFDRDWYECQRENSNPAAYVDQYSGSAGTVVNFRMAQACMAARGWRPVRGESTPMPAPATRTTRPTGARCDPGTAWDSQEGQCVTGWFWMVPPTLPKLSQTGTVSQQPLRSWTVERASTTPAAECEQLRAQQVQEAEGRAQHAANDHEDVREALSHRPVTGLEREDVRTALRLLIRAQLVRASRCVASDDPELRTPGQGNGRRRYGCNGDPRIPCPE